MKAVLISISPLWTAPILDGSKTLEIRKNCPKMSTPFMVYIYETKGGGGRGQVVAEFTCDNIKCFNVPYPAFQTTLDPEILKASRVTYYALHRYAYHDSLYGWHISGLKVYGTPMELSKFVCRKPLKHPPQSWCYVAALGKAADHGQ